MGGPVCRTWNTVLRRLPPTKAGIASDSALFPSFREVGLLSGRMPRMSWKIDGTGAFKAELLKELEGCMQMHVGFPAVSLLALGGND